MPFPVYQVPFAGNGLIIGLNAVIHVLLSHGIAIGAMAMIALGLVVSRRAAAGLAAEWERYLSALLTVSVILITGAGAVTGAGIWITVSALAPAGIGSAIRIFFWPWFIEWGVFTLEVVAIVALYLGWKRLHARERLRYAAAYVVLAAISGFLISGILGFMLTPDGWPASHSTPAGFFNATWLPQACFRISFGIGLGAVFAMAMLLLGRWSAELRMAGLRAYGAVLGGSAVATVACGAVYLAAAPRNAWTNWMFAVLTSHWSQRPGLLEFANMAGAVAIAGLALAAAARRTRLARILVVPAAIFAAGFVTEFERIREFIRGPYLLPGYMYASGLTINETLHAGDTSLLADSPWSRIAGRSGLQAGAHLFARNCAACHTVGGINDIRRRLRGRSQDGIFVMLSHTHDMVPFMTPFAGSREERAILADFLYRVAQDGVEWRSRSRFLVREGAKQ